MSSAVQLVELCRSDQPHRSQATTIPKQKLPGRSARKIDSHAQVLGRRRRGQQHQAGHPRLKDDRLMRIEPNDDTLAHALHAGDDFADHTAAKRRRPRLDPNRPLGTLCRAQVVDAAADNRQNAAAHRLNLRKLGHACFSWRKESGGAFYRADNAIDKDRDRLRPAAGT